MQDDTGDNDEPAISGWLTDVLQGGAPQLILGKTVARASGRLLTSATNIPAAALENVAQRIRSDTGARKRVKDAIVVAASKAAKGNPEIVEHFTERWTGMQLRRQSNREAVGARTLELLADDPPSEDVDVGPSDDFMNFFEDLGEKASSEALRDLCARVLAGESRKPGSYSLRTLHLVVCIMEQPLATALQRASSLLLADSGIPLIMRKHGSYRALNATLSTPDLSVISILQDYCILGSWRPAVELKRSEAGLLTLTFREWAMILSVPEGTTYSLRVALLTTMGKEVMTLIPAGDEESSVRDFVLAMKSEIPSLSKAEIAKIHTESDGTVKIDSRCEV